MAVTAPRAAVFLDKDGTLIDDVPYNVDPARITLAEGAGEGLRCLTQLGFRLFVVSNQPGVALGRFDLLALDRVGHCLRALLRAQGVMLSGFYVCPHRPGAGCDCRKPRPGMLLQAAAEHGVDLGASWMIGDILDDVEAGRRAGCRTLLIDNGNETIWHRSSWRWPELTAPDLARAARRIARWPGAPP